jgi:ankyrin repeat protein
MGLFEDCFDGSLTTTNLKRYLADTDINAVHPQKGVTPLIAAIFGGHLATVQRLLEVGKCDADAPSIDGQTPLLWASVARKNRAQIVSLLLERHIDVDANCEATQHQTPLMRVLNGSRDPDVIRMLVNRGASLTIRNKKSRQTPEDIARKLNDPVVMAALYPSKTALDLEGVVKVIVGLIGIIIAWVNSETVNKVIKGVTEEMNDVVKKMYGVGGERDAELEQASSENVPSLLCLRLT